MGQNVIPIEYTKIPPLDPLPNPRSQLNFILSPDLIQKDTVSPGTKHRQPPIYNRITRAIGNILEPEIPIIKEIWQSFRDLIKDTFSNIHKKTFENSSSAQAGSIRISDALFVGGAVFFLILIAAAAADSILHPEEWITPTPDSPAGATQVYTPPTQKTSIPQIEINTQTTSFIRTFQLFMKQLQEKYPNVLDERITKIITAQPSLFIIQPKQTVTQKIEQELGINGDRKEQRAKALQQYLGWNPQKQEHMHEIYVILIRNVPNGPVVYGGSSNEVFTNPVFNSVNSGDAVLVIPTQGENPQVYKEIMEQLKNTYFNNRPNRIHDFTH